MGTRFRFDRLCVIVSFLAAICAVLWSCTENWNSPAGETFIDKSPVTGELRHFPASVSSVLPYDVDENRVRRLDDAGFLLSAQREFDILAWQSFISLNWPADSSGSPSKEKTIADRANPRVWNFWRTAGSIFLPDGAKPDPWSNELAKTELYRAKAAWRVNTTNADENFQAFSGPLVDQNGNWVRYQVMVNQEEFSYIFDNNLYSLEGQSEFSQRPTDNWVEMPMGNSKLRKRGAIEIKLAWKELAGNDDPRRFFTTKVRVMLSEPIKPGNTPPSKEITAGLVGFHIAMRTKSSPEWIWATFEQIDNVPHSGQNGVKRHLNFNDSDPTHQQPATFNQLPPRNAVIDPVTGQLTASPDPKTATTWIESLTKTPVQVARFPVPTQGQLNPMDAQIVESTDELNKEVQALLAKEGSVFQYYELVGTQWPVHPNAPAVPGGEGSAPESISHKTPGDVVPVFLVNTSMETYFMRGLQPAGPLEQDDRLSSNAPPIDHTMVTATESCVGCHYSAGICIGFKKNSDGSYMLNNGYRVPIFGENANFGRNGNGNFSWLFQIEGHGKKYVPTSQPVVTPSPANQLDIGKH